MEKSPKYQKVFDALASEIESGRFKTGDRLPSEAELERTFGASRITVGRAVRDLQLAGLVERRAGSGSYVKARSVTDALSFGLLIPDLGETEIFEPICQGMMASPLARQHALLWGSLPSAAASKEERAWQLCRQYIDRRVSGVFFAPLELTPGKDAVNRRIAQALDDTGIPLVLLDRTVVPYPDRGVHDLVGIDNRRAGYRITEHLLHLGSRQIAFVAVQNAAATVEAREAGYREALYAWNSPINREFVHRLDPTELDSVRTLMASKPEAIVCANDWTAARLMRSILELGYSIPADVRLVGIDDLDYANLLPVPLTTLRQPTREIGAAAFAAMLDRVSRPETPVRDILLQTQLVVRRSCGASVETPETARRAQ
ncbi:MAG: GntR family transcriptional regulator [Acidobacteria bacterium 13_1_40CM_65_14]|nr:MAG: GntR family transcriptional regulator [Acidobacteria bacterium 13_1_40CM_65_14]OLE84142.1 MAG: GntR family transcriptional regulator [Acidobacteria bacterium 13_1_20CM_2_65_9]